MNKNGKAYCETCGKYLYNYETTVKVFCSFKCSDNYREKSEKPLEKWEINKMIHDMFDCLSYFDYIFKWYFDVELECNFHGFKAKYIRYLELRDKICKINWSD